MTEERGEGGYVRKHCLSMHPSKTEERGGKRVLHVQRRWSSGGLGGRRRRRRAPGRPPGRGTGCRSGGRSGSVCVSVGEGCGLVDWWVRMFVTWGTGRRSGRCSGSVFCWFVSLCVCVVKGVRWVGGHCQMHRRRQTCTAQDRCV